MPPTSATGRRAAQTGRRAALTGRRAARGFTLVEVLVALSLLAIVGLTLVEFQSLQLRNSAALTASSLARLEADNQAIAILLAPNAPAGSLRGSSLNGGVPLVWEAETRGSPSPDAFPNLVTISVRVRASEGGPVLAAREIVRPQ
ncbi:MAG: type II secretion system minor pseudopilin GspI [Sphingomonadaceae bacterium]